MSLGRHILSTVAKKTRKYTKMSTGSMVTNHSNINKEEMVALHAKSSTLGEAKMAGDELNECERTSTSLVLNFP